MMAAASRRELATRNAPWARRLAAWLARAGARPNAVSMTSVVFAVGALAAFVGAGPRGSACGFGRYERAALFVVAAAAIQLRLLCNLLDGLLAVEEQLGRRGGELYNEIPDRVADVIILVGAGLSFAGVLNGPALGCAAAIAAVFTAYVRALGGSSGVTQSFAGPMAKQHRMFVLTVGALTSTAETMAGLPARSMPITLVVIVIGAVVTAWRRIGLIARELEAR